MTVKEFIKALQDHVELLPHIADKQMGFITKQNEILTKWNYTLPEGVCCELCQPLASGWTEGNFYFDIQAEL